MWLCCRQYRSLEEDSGHDAEGGDGGSGGAQLRMRGEGAATLECFMYHFSIFDEPNVPIEMNVTPASATLHARVPAVLRPAVRSCAHCLTQLLLL